MSRVSRYLLTTALVTGLLSSCVSEDESSEAIHQEDLRKIQAFVESTDIPYSRKIEAGNTGIILLFTEENEDGLATEEADSLFVNYTGYLLDGQVFDTSVEQVARENNMYTPGIPYEPYPVALWYTRVIPGWHYALDQMRAGEKATVLIPSSLAYGRQGQGLIEPNSVLAFDLELVEVRKR